MRTTGCSEFDFARLFLPAYYRQEQGHAQRGLSDCGPPSHRSNIVSRPHAASPHAPLAGVGLPAGGCRNGELSSPPLPDTATASQRARECFDQDLSVQARACAPVLLLVAMLLLALHACANFRRPPCWMHSRSLRIEVVSVCTRTHVAV